MQAALDVLMVTWEGEGQGSLWWRMEKTERCRRREETTRLHPPFYFDSHNNNAHLVSDGHYNHLSLPDKRLALVKRASLP